MNNKRPQIVNSEIVKNIIIPFNGFYQSFIDTEFDAEIEQYTLNEIEDEQSQYDFNDWLYSSLTVNDAFKRFYNTVSEGLTNFIVDKLNEEYNINLLYSYIEYHKMTLQNTGDNISADININNLLNLDNILSYFDFTIDELFNELQKVADSKLKSCSGFISFYDHDMTALKGVSLDKWESVYIEVLIDFLALDYFGDFTAIEIAYIEETQSYGGLLEIFLNCLDGKDLDKFNGFSDGDSDYI